MEWPLCGEKNEQDSSTKRNRLWSYKWEAVFQKAQSNDKVEDDSQKHLLQTAVTA